MAAIAGIPCADPRVDSPRHKSTTPLWGNSQVDLTATHAVYQELHLSEVALTGKNIKINLRQILRGKPIQLREPIALTGQLKLTAPDLEASLSAPLLATALDELLATLVANSSHSSDDNLVHRNLGNDLDGDRLQYPNAS
ncbi:MAG: DUF2993 domain-containing protein, partial [Coleofasciculaceae cyanobacterium SM2_1_6]|nr:DUF2993 domain-containing protein [Coleofasciculaceae cyanobacterium SM2_1_6]